MSYSRNIAALVASCAVLLGGTWATNKIATDYLLRESAMSAARSWALYLTENVSDLEQIADGEQPSAASMAFFESARRSHQVFRYEIFNRSGYSQLVSDRSRIALLDFAEFRDQAARALATRQPLVDARAGDSPDWPSYFAEAYVPVIVDGRAIATVAAYVDQTEQRDTFYGAFLIVATLLCA